MIHCETVGQLKAALGGLPDDAPLLVEYDGGSGCSVVGQGQDLLPDWADADTAVLSIDYTLGNCDNVRTVRHECTECPYTPESSYWSGDDGGLIRTRLSGEGLMPAHTRRVGTADNGNAIYDACNGSQMPPRPESGVVGSPE